MTDKNIVSEELLSKINGGLFDENVKDMLRTRIDTLKRIGMNVNYFISKVINNWAEEDREAVEKFIREYWGE